MSKYGEDKSGWTPKRDPRHRLSGLWLSFLLLGMCPMFGGNLERVLVSKCLSGIKYIFGLEIEWG